MHFPWKKNSVLEKDGCRKMPFPTLPSWIQEILQLNHWGISFPPWRSLQPLSWFLHFTGRQGDERGQEILSHPLPSTAKAVLAIAVLLEEPWSHWTWISADEITTVQEGPRSTWIYRCLGWSFNSIYIKNIIWSVSILNTNTFPSNTQLSFVPFCSIFLLGKQLTSHNFLYKAAFKGIAMSLKLKYCLATRMLHT